MAKSFEEMDKLITNLYNECIKKEAAKHSVRLPLLKLTVAVEELCDENEKLKKQVEFIKQYERDKFEAATKAFGVESPLLRKLEDQNNE